MSFKSCFNPYLMSKKDLIALNAKRQYTRIVGCVKIVTIFSFAKNATKKGINLRVFMQIPTKSITYIQNYFDIL